MIALWLIGCVEAPATPDTGSEVPLGWFSDDPLVRDTATCEDVVVDVEPDGSGAWYWRDPATVRVATGNQEAYSARLLDSLGLVVPTSTTWADTGLAFTVEVEGHFAPTTDYSLEVTDCTGATKWPFSTSALGAPLTAGSSSLQGNTYMVDFSQATWLEPAGFGTVLAVYFDKPVLIGVEWADDGMLDLMGSQGVVSESGILYQNIQDPTWDFPAAPFSEAPYFLANSDVVVVTFSDVDVPLNHFAISGTFSADGTTLGGAVATGLGDTRNMGVLVGEGDDPNAICVLASRLGALCEACPDGEPYCMAMYATDVEGTLRPELELVKIE